MILKSRPVLILGPIVLALVLLYNNCGVLTKFSVNQVTSVGNPMAPVSTEVMYGVCGVINRCNPNVTLDQCQTGIMTTPNFNTPLGLSPTYSTFSSIFQAEQNGVITGNLSAGNNCYDSINTLNCSDPTVQAAYDPSSPNPFSGVPNMIPVTACNQVFAPGVNLEVPIELPLGGGASAPGVSSSTAPITFSRTRTSLDTTDYDGTVTYSFEIVGTNSDTASRNISLVDSFGTTVASITVPIGTSAPTRFRNLFTPTSGASNYRIQLDATTAGNELNAFESRILVKQVGATQTKIYVPLVNSYNNYADGAASNGDNSTAAIEAAIFGGSYTHSNPQFYSQWTKNDLAFSQLVSGNAFTLEAIISTSVAGTSTAYASLFDFTSGNQVTSSEVTTTQSTPTLVSLSFPDSDPNFVNLDNMELRIKNDGSGANAYIYGAGLWIKLTNLTHAEVYYRYNNGWYQFASGHDQSSSQMVMLDTSVFSSPVSIYHEGTGYVDALTTPCTESVLDIGTADSGTVGALVPGASFSFTTTTPTIQRTPTSSITSGHRFISDILANPGPGDCIIPQTRLVVGF